MPTDGSKRMKPNPPEASGSTSVKSDSNARSRARRSTKSRTASTFANSQANGLSVSTLPVTRSVSEGTTITVPAPYLGPPRLKPAPGTNWNADSVSELASQSTHSGVPIVTPIPSSKIALDDDVSRIQCYFWLCLTLHVAEWTPH
jgi:hypothetical protein